MPEFGIFLSVSGEIYSDEDNRRLLKWNLCDEWSIVCVLQEEVDNDPNRDLKWTSIEIHREIALEKVSISGILSLHHIKSELWCRNISCFMKTGLKSAEIASDVGLRYTPNRCKLIGLVRIPNASENEESKLKIQRKSLEELSKDLERVLNPDSSSLTDLIFLCGDTSFRAHKIILSARSPFFASVFASPMEEDSIREIHIDSIDESVFREVLTYIYTGKTSDLTASSAAELLVAAHRCELQDLKMVCIYFLKNTTSLENVGRILNMGEKYSKDLKSFALDYICKNWANYSAFENTKAWKDLRPNLAVEVQKFWVIYKNENRRRLRI